MNSCPLLSPERPGRHARHRLHIQSTIETILYLRYPADEEPMQDDDEQDRDEVVEDEGVSENVDEERIEDGVALGDVV